MLKFGGISPGFMIFYCVCDYCCGDGRLMVCAWLVLVECARDVDSQLIREDGLFGSHRSEAALPSPSPLLSRRCHSPDILIDTVWVNRISPISCHISAFPSPHVSNFAERPTQRCPYMRPLIALSTNPMSRYSAAVDCTKQCCLTLQATHRETRSHTNWTEKDQTSTVLSFFF